MVISLFLFYFLVCFLDEYTFLFSVSYHEVYSFDENGSSIKDSAMIELRDEFNKE